MGGGGGGIQDFEVVCKLGLGAYAGVYKAVRRVDGRTYAIKRVKLEGLEQQDLAMTLNEIRLLASFRHPRIVRLHETFLDGGGDARRPLHLCVVMEYCGFQDLERKIRRYRARGEHVDERVVWVYLVQTLEALQALHSLKILHRDIKPANILLDEEGNAKLGDLNVSKCVDDGGEVQAVVGTLPYMAPEIWRGEAFAFPADLYALGCTLFELAALLPPFDGASALQLQRAVLKRKFQTALPGPEVYSQELRDVIMLLIHPDAEARLTAERLLALPQVASRLYLVRHKLPEDLPPPTPLTACAPIDEATVTLAELPTLLPSLLPGPSYYPPSPLASSTPPPAEEGEADDDEASRSPSPSPSPPPAVHEGDDHHASQPPPSQEHQQQQHRKKRRERARKKQHPAVQEALLLRGGSEGDAAASIVAGAAVGAGITGGSPSSLRALLKSPYPDDVSSPESTSPGGGRRRKASPTHGRRQYHPSSSASHLRHPEQGEEKSGGAGAQAQVPAPDTDAQQQLQQTRRSRRPPSLPTARLNALYLGTGTTGAGTGAAGKGEEKAAEQGATKEVPAAVALTVVTAAGAPEAGAEAADAEAPWERVPTPTSFTVPLPSPSPASPYQLPPALALSPDGPYDKGPPLASGAGAGASSGRSGGGVIAAEEGQGKA